MAVSGLAGGKLSKQEKDERKYPILLFEVFASLVVAFLAKMPPCLRKNAMMEGKYRIAIPLFATIAFLYMSSVINKVGLVSLLSDWFAPYLNLAPIQIMLPVSTLATVIPGPELKAASCSSSRPF